MSKRTEKTIKKILKKIVKLNQQMFNEKVLVKNVTQDTAYEIMSRNEIKGVKLNFCDGILKIKKRF